MLISGGKIYMGFNNKKVVFTNEILVNKIGQIHLQKSFLFFFTTRFFRFIFAHK
jgi:hypothetical protein